MKKNLIGKYQQKKKKKNKIFFLKKIINFIESNQIFILLIIYK